MHLGSGATNNQKLFLEHHKGPGVHHIAFNTFDIVRTISRLEEAGVIFVPQPPATYYEDMQNQFSKFDHPVFVPSMKEHGILVDIEKGQGLIERIKNNEKYILQKFCRPLVENSGETVFVEVIERRGGAKAFGAGNVAALWKALVRQLERDNINNKAKKSSFSDRETVAR